MKSSPAPEGFRTVAMRPIANVRGGVRYAAIPHSVLDATCPSAGIAMCFWVLILAKWTGRQDRQRGAEVSEA